MPTEAPQDHIDAFLTTLAPLDNVEIDPEVEGIVDRIGGLNRRIKRAAEQTVTEFGLTLGDWRVLSKLRLSSPGLRSTPGELASWVELSSGAMTSRLDSLERQGFVRRVPDPGDRRSVVVELTEQGRDAWDAAASVQGRKEAFFASALTKSEQRQLNALLRKLMLAFEAREAAEKHDGRHRPPAETSS